VPAARYRAGDAQRRLSAAARSLVAMKLTTTVLCVSAAWLTTISGLHAWLNLDFGRAEDAGPSFRVGFLPVT